jgi:hypothetical protein
MIKRILLSLLEMDSDKTIGRTGKKAHVSGLYRSNREYIALTKGETFPPSINSRWILVVSV